MLQRSFYLPEELYNTLQLQAKEDKIAVAELIRRYLEKGIKKERKQRQKGIGFLLKLVNYKLKGHKDLAKRHDKYTWE